jgi:hypothetical protein
MRTQIEKNMESLMEDIERHSTMTMTEDVVTRLAVCFCAYKALCATDGKEYVIEAKTAHGENKEGRTLALDGDTEFESVILSMPYDSAHMEAVVGIFADHMDSLAVINRRAYDNIMARLREVAKN